MTFGKVGIYGRLSLFLSVCCGAAAKRESYYFTDSLMIRHARMDLLVAALIHDINTSLMCVLRDAYMSLSTKEQL